MLLFGYPNVIIYPEVFNPLIAYCIFVLVFLCPMCVCHVVNKIYLLTYLLTLLHMEQMLLFYRCHFFTFFIFLFVCFSVFLT